MSVSNIPNRYRISVSGDWWRWETAEVRNILLRVHDSGSWGGRVEYETGLYACSAERSEAAGVSVRVVGGVLCRRLSLDEAPQVRGQRRLACTGQDHGATMDVLRLNVTIQHRAFSRLPLSLANDSS